MKQLLTPEVAQAIRRGEVDYAKTLHDMELVRSEKTSIVHVDNLNANQKLGYDNLERRLRGAA